MEKEQKSCIICGNYFIPKLSSQLTCCKQCSAKNNDLRKKYSVKKRRYESSESTMHEIMDITAKAEAEGLTYGQYVNQHGG